MVTSKILAQDEWLPLAADQFRRASEWTEPYRTRSAKGKIHPIYDFLFLYYRIKPSQLESWHPGFGVGIQVPSESTRFSDRHYVRNGPLVYLDNQKMDTATRHRIEMALALSEAIASRPPQFGCFGMHEWAMVYQGDKDGEVRHGESLPFRLSQKQINDFVESRPINCSHFDAFRFFSPSAKPFNRIQPTKLSRIETEQCGCLHTNMDLYKLSGQCMPWVGSEMLWKSFELAVRARKIDMRASPYDCTSLGYSAIPIEQAEGRQTYEEYQRELSEHAGLLREELIKRLEEVLAKP